MAARNFPKCLELVLQFEGFYDNDPDDPGGETYKGITRRDHPDWPGWQMIDSRKGRDDFPDLLEDLAALQSLLRDLYKKVYWRKNRCDQLPAPLDLLVFDTAVNMGPRKAGRFLQQAVNKVLGQATLKEDGVIGEQTLAAVTSLHRAAGEELCFYFLEFREQNYYEIVAAKPKLRKFLRGWLNRVARLKEQVEKVALA